MASVKTDQSTNGLRNDFEAAATHILPYDPMQKKRVDHGTKRGPAGISDATGEEAYVNVSSFGTKKGNGSSEVPLRYHKKEEYDLLNSLGTGFFFCLTDHFGPLSQPITGHRGMFT